MLFDLSCTLQVRSTVSPYQTLRVSYSLSLKYDNNTIIFSGPPGARNARANIIGADMVLVVVNPSSSGGLPTSNSVTISNSSYECRNYTPAFLNGSAMVSFTCLTNSTNYTISVMAINCAGSSNTTKIDVSCKYKCWCYTRTSHYLVHVHIYIYNCGLMLKHWFWCCVDATNILEWSTKIVPLLHLDNATVVWLILL